MLGDYKFQILIMKHKNFSIEKLQSAVLKSKNKTEFANNLGFKSLNGRICKILNKYIKDFNLDLSHFDLKWKNRKFKIIEKHCPICNALFVTKQGHSKETFTCSHKCSNKLFSKTKCFKRKKTTKNTFSIKQNFICKFCNSEFNSIRKNAIFCNKSCYMLYISSSSEYKEQRRVEVYERIKKGTFIGWKSREKCSRSYAELYFENLLIENGYLKNKDYIIEYPQGKWFIDFAFPNLKIALEIDGKQHEIFERKLKDLEKDDYLTNQGWKIIRVKWKKCSESFKKDLISLIKDLTPLSRP